MCGVVVAGGRGVENVSVWAPHISGVAAANVDTKVAPRPMYEVRAAHTITTTTTTAAATNSTKRNKLGASHFGRGSCLCRYEGRSAADVRGACCSYYYDDDDYCCCYE